MRLKKIELKILMFNKMKEGMSKQKAYEQVMEEIDFMNRINKKEEKKDFKKVFKDLKYTKRNE